MLHDVKGGKSMSVMGEMLCMRQDLINENRAAAMDALVRSLHYRIAHCDEKDDLAVIFADKESAEAFCKNNLLDRRAFDWLLDGMREEGLLTPDKEKITLTLLGVEKLCL